MVYVKFRAWLKRINGARLYQIAEVGFRVILLWKSKPSGRESASAAFWS